MLGQPLLEEAQPGSRPTPEPTGGRPEEHTAHGEPGARGAEATSITDALAFGTGPVVSDRPVQVRHLERKACW